MNDEVFYLFKYNALTVLKQKVTLQRVFYSESAVREFHSRMITDKAYAHQQIAIDNHQLGGTYLGEYTILRYMVSVVEVFDANTGD